MIYAIYAIALSLLSIYSYSQIDLNLTLSSNPIYQYFQNQLILLGYYNRPLSTGLLVLLLILLYLIYLKILYLVKNKKLSGKSLGILVILTGIILFFSYSAFSHDLFNYMFDAKIVTTYHQNPYIHSALDFPGDLWTRFMHWTHRTYPYGPAWLVITLVPSLLGFNKFVLTLINFKFMFVIFHTGNVYLIYKILTKTNKNLALLGTAFYAFNPVVLIESLVSPHNEVMMLFFLLLAIYQIFDKNNKIFGIISLLFSGGIKFATLILLPVFIFAQNTKKSSVWFLAFLILIAVTLIAEIIFREPYAWYFIPILGIGALLVGHKNINIFISGISLGAFARYLPYLYAGEYGKSVRSVQDTLFIAAIFTSLFIISFRPVYKKWIFRKA